MPDSDILNEILSKPRPLSQEQAAAVSSGARYIRIIAGAGAGKTEVLTRRIAYLLLVKGVDPSSIVAFTFTEKAAKSMKSRIYERISELRGETATSRLGEMFVGTIHGYAKQLLEDKFDFGNHKVFDENQEVAYLMRVGWSLGFERNGYSEHCLEFLRTTNMVTAEMIDHTLLKQQARDFYNKMKGYEALLEENKRLTFGQMIYTLVLKLRENASILDKVKYLLVDEYQDINRAQAELINLIGKKAELFVVGDPRQSIYQWRGSNERFFEEFSEAFPETEKLAIKENRRSLAKIVDVANRFADTFARARYEHLQTTRVESEGTVALANFDDEEGEAEWIANQIERLHQTNKLNYSDFGVLFRSVNTSAGPLLEVFRRRNIPYIVGGKVGLFKRAETQSIGRIFAWLYQDGHRFVGRWAKDGNPITSKEDLLQTALNYWTLAYRRAIPTDAQGRLRHLDEELHNEDDSDFESFSQIFHYIINSLGYMNLNPQGDPVDAAIMANLGRFDTLISDYESANRLGGRRTRDWQAEMKNFFWFVNTYANQAYEEQPSDDIRSINAVQIMTVHQAKGLEWPVVFLPALTDKRFPSTMAGNQQSWYEVPRNLFEVQRYEGGLEDERRLFYVGLTRAKDLLILSYFRSKGRESHFLSDVDPALLTVIEQNNDLPVSYAVPSRDSSELQTFSAGEVIIYEVCPQLFRFREIWGYQPEFNQYIGYGDALHYCLRKASELVKAQNFSTTSAIATAVDENFHLPYIGGKHLDDARKGAKKTLMEFIKKYGDDLKKIEEVEYRLEFPLANSEDTKATIMGKVDVVLKNADQREVREYKTSEEARSFENSATQVELYTIGLRNMGKSITAGSVAYLKENEVRPVNINDNSLQATKERAADLINRILSRDFNARPGNHCSKCDYRDICRWKNGV